MAKPPLYSSGPFYRCVAVTPNDSTDIEITRGLLVGTTGAVKIHDGAGNACTITLTAGYPHPIVASRVWSTGTTAGSIVALY
jgi:hypothetical protein